MVGRCAQLLLLLIAGALVVPASAQVREELLEGSPLGKPGKATKPVPVQDPKAPSGRVPKLKPKQPDPRGVVPAEASRPGAVAPEIVRPGLDRVDPREIDSRKKSDLGVRIVEAVIPQVEVVVEVENRGPEPLDRRAVVRVSVDQGDGCDWPRGNPVQTVTGLRVGERRRLVVRIRNPECAEPSRWDRPRDQLFVVASVLPSTAHRQGYADPNPANDRARASLASVLRDDRTAPPPRGERRVRVKLSNLVFRIGCQEGAYDRDSVCELEWIKLQLHDAPERKFDHRQLSVMQPAAGGTHHSHYLEVRSGAYLGVPHAAWAEAVAYEGERLELVLKARDMDCAGDRDCRRGDTGRSVYVFQVPHFDPGFEGNCDAKQPVESLRGWSGDFRGWPALSLPSGSPAAYPAEVCFEPAG